MIRFLIKKRVRKTLAIFLAVNFLVPQSVYALTSGPTQPEVQGFQQIGTSEMVNLFTGDFSYNIPLFELPGPNGGYPFNLAYSAGVGMEEEASWVGLGWSLNPGAINRQMRGIPDEFDGTEKSERELDIADNTTFGVGINSGIELIGLLKKKKDNKKDDGPDFDPDQEPDEDHPDQDPDQDPDQEPDQNPDSDKPKKLKLFKNPKFSIPINFGRNVFYNSETGVGSSWELGAGVNFSINLVQLKSGAESKFKKFFNLGSMTSLKGNLSIGSNGANAGYGASASLKPSLNGKISKNTEINLGTNLTSDIGINYNSREGLEISKGTHLNSTFSFSTKLKRKRKRDLQITLSIPESTVLGSSITFASTSYTPQINMPLQGKNWMADAKLGLGGGGTFSHVGANVYRQVQSLKTRIMSLPAIGYMNLENATDNSILDFNREKDATISEQTPYLAMPTLTYDIYTANAQGMSAMYRPFRNDIGNVWDQEVVSESKGKTYGVETSIPFTGHVGANTGKNYSKSVSGKWPELADKVPFVAKNGLDETVYFKVAGESVSQHKDQYNSIGGYNPMMVEMNNGNVVTKDATENDDNEEHNAINLLDEKGFTNKNSNKSYNSKTISNQTRILDKKPARNTVILPLKNGELMDDVEESLSQFKISYITYDENGQEKEIPYDRKEKKANHIAGFTVLHPNGLRYIYALPAYNLSQIDVTFSHCEDGVLNCEFDPSIGQESSGKDVINIRPHDDDSEKPKYNYNGTDQYYSSNKMEAYPYAFLLTSIIGSDYVDAEKGIIDEVDTDGPSDNDLGYWVKFKYKQESNQYKWRAPFFGAKFNSGIRNAANKRDDKAMFTYGEKEIWYLHSAETATHKANFILNEEERHDGRGAAQMIQNDDENVLDEFKYGVHQRYLKEIELRSKLEDDNDKNLIKKVHFDYDYSLCQGVLNNVETSPDKNGKLTLKQLHFTYGKSNLGEETPYKFHYDGAKFPYNTYTMDRWGNYKPVEEITDGQGNPIYDEYGNKDFPYIDQLEDRSVLDSYVAPWSLSKIDLPSGGTIKVTYESDDYGYVQNREAMYMTNIEAIANDISEVIDSEGSFIEANSDKPEQLLIGKNKTKVFFKLKNPILRKVNNEEVITNQQKFNEILKYVDTDHWQLYYKTKIALQEPDKHNYYEFVAGYADIDPITTLSDVGNNETNSAGFVGKKTEGENEYYTHGYITILPVIEKHNGKSYHPFSVAAWQHIQVRQPRLYNDQVGLKSGILPSSPGKQMIDEAFNFLSSKYKDAMGQLIKGFFKWAGDRSWGRQMRYNKSWVRLRVPDKTKVGGGLRVAKIELSDNWNWSNYKNSTNVEAATYGQVYDYTTLDEDGSVISSGVAAYEPIMGGDENAMRYALGYVQEIKARNDNHHFFEYPINESLYPGAHVGYSKVTVKSLASANPSFEYQKIDSQGNEEEGTGYHPTSGVTINEFFTAKDYPVYSEATPIDIYMPMAKTKNTPFKAKLEKKYAASQGYVTILNDMHGKPKQTSHYSQKEDGKIDKMISSVIYEYHDEEIVINDKSSRLLKNLVPTLKNDVDLLTKDKVEDQQLKINIGDTDGDGEDNYASTPIDNEGNISVDMTEDRIVGEDVEMFIDARQSYTYAENKNKSFNLDQITGFLFLPMYVPNKHTTRTTSRTVVVNKIINRVGLLKSVKANNAGSEIITKNEVWDAQTGSVLLTSVNNNFNNKIYNYSIPAYMKYEGMGPAYENIGIKIEAILKKQEGKENYYTAPIIQDYESVAFPGDEFIVSLSNGKKAKAIYVGNNTSNSSNVEMSFYSQDIEDHFTFSDDCLVDDTSCGEEVTAQLFLYRSGKRNILGAMAGSITSLGINPLETRKITNSDGVIGNQEKIWVPIRPGHSFDTYKSN